MNAKQFADAFNATLADERNQRAQIDAIYAMLRVLMAHELHKLTNAERKASMPTMPHGSDGQ